MMIEKLKPNEDKIFRTESGEMMVVPALNVPQCISDKINELCDAVNSIVSVQEKLIDSRFMVETKHEEPADPYAEQRRWIGCICRFWFDNPDDTTLDYLGKIQTGENGIEYYGKETYDWFPHCEPVKPDDDIIYKGE